MLITSPPNPSLTRTTSRPQPRAHPQHKHAHQRVAAHRAQDLRVPQRVLHVPLHLAGQEAARSPHPALGGRAVAVQEVAAGQQQRLDGGEDVEEVGARALDAVGVDRGVALGAGQRAVLALRQRAAERRRQRHVQPQAQREHGVQDAPQVGGAVGGGLLRLLRRVGGRAGQAAEERVERRAGEGVGAAGGAAAAGHPGHAAAGHHLREHLHHGVLVQALGAVHAGHRRGGAVEEGVSAGRRRAGAGGRGTVEAKHHLAQLGFGDVVGCVAGRSDGLGGLVVVLRDVDFFRVGMLLWGRGSRRSRGGWSGSRLRCAGYWRRIYTGKS